MLNKIMDAINDFNEKFGKKPNALYLTADEILVLKKEVFNELSYPAKRGEKETVFGLDLMYVDEKRDKIVGIE